MQALRNRFQPQEPATQYMTSTGLSPRLSSRDYFTYVPTSPAVRAPSLPSITPKTAMTPAAEPGRHRNSLDGFTKMTADDAHAGPNIMPLTAEPIDAGTTRPSSKAIRRASSLRKQVAAGDLAMTSSALPNENGGAYYRPATLTPGLPRTETWRGRLSGSTIDLRPQNGMPLDSPPDGKEDTFELREAVLMCIAKSIGLAQPSEGNLDSLGRASKAASVSAVSTPNSPMFPPGVRSSSRSPFGNVLDMMNASANNDNIIGGMLREAALHARLEDDMSSISGSVHDSQGGVSAITDVDKNVLRDLEGNVHILYFKKGSSLVKEGERSPGIYYVIDGFLEVSEWKSKPC